MGAAEALGGSIHNRLEDTIGIVDQFIVPDAHDTPTFLLKEAVTALIARGLRVLASVQFNDQSCLSAGEVGGIRTDR